MKTEDVQGRVGATGEIEGRGGRPGNPARDCKPQRDFADEGEEIEAGCQGQATDGRNAAETIQEDRRQKNACGDGGHRRSRSGKRRPELRKRRSRTEGFAQWKTEPGRIGDDHYAQKKPKHPNHKRPRQQS